MNHTRVMKANDAGTLTGNGDEGTYKLKRRPTAQRCIQQYLTGIPNYLFATNTNTVGLQMTKLVQELDKVSIYVTNAVLPLSQASSALCPTLLDLWKPTTVYLVLKESHRRQLFEITTYVRCM